MASYDGPYVIRMCPECSRKWLSSNKLCFWCFDDDKNIYGVEYPEDFAQIVKKENSDG